MKFKIRFADQIVGFFIIAAIVVLVFVIILIGSSQRWFAKDYSYTTAFDSAAGLSKNMSITFKGFTIGRVSAFELDDTDKVQVTFYIFDTYIDRVRKGSLVNVSVSPVGLGNSFQFYPGLGRDILPEGSLIPAVGSPEAQDLIAKGLAKVPKSTDSISAIIEQVGQVLENLNTIASQVQEVLGTVDGALKGSGETSLGRTLTSVEGAVGGVQHLTNTLPDNINGAITDIMGQLNPILANLQTLSVQLASPDSSIGQILDPSGPVYANLVSTLEGISGTLANLEKTSAGLPNLVPELTVAIEDIRTALKSAQDVLTALTNNPLLKGGIPPRVQSDTGGTSPRDLSF